MASTSAAAATMGAKKPCLNDSRLTYTGKESSPRGLGYCAEAEAVGTIKEGRDDKRWMVVIKNNVNVWTRIPEDASVLAKKESRPHPEITPAEDEAPAAPPVPAPKKKTAAPKKKPAAAAKPAAEPAPESEKPASEPPAVESEKPAAEPPAAELPAAKKPAAKKPAAKKPAAEAEKPTATAAAAKKPPTDFNLYIKYRLAQLKTLEPEMTHAQRFSQAAKDWGALSPEQKATEIAAARAEFA